MLRIGRILIDIAKPHEYDIVLPVILNDTRVKHVTRMSSE